MQASVAKQYLQINGQTVLEHSLSTLLARPDVCQVVLCVAEDDTTWADLAITQGARVVNTIGGSTRAESVMNGLRTLTAVADADDWGLVHDAARPCLSSDLLDNLIEQLADHITRFCLHGLNGYGHAATQDIDSPIKKESPKRLE